MRMKALSTAKAVKKELSTIKSISTGTSIVGGVLTYGLAGYEVATGNAIILTFVDVGMITAGLIAIGVGAVVASLGIAVGAAVVGFEYSSSALGLGKKIDKGTRKEDNL